MCNPITDPDHCVGNAIGGIAGAAYGGAVDKFFEMIANGARDALGAVSSFWMKVPSPTVATGGGQNWSGSQTITSIQSWIAPVGLVIFTVTLGLALLKIAFDTRRAGEGSAAILRSLVTTMAGGLPLLAVTMLLIQAGDEFSPWILDKASGQDVSENGFAKIMQVSMMGTAHGLPNPSGALLIIYLLAIVGAAVQVVFMIVRGAALILLLCFAQVIATGTATEEGWLRFKRIVMLVIGFALYKPVAAIVLGVGLKLMSDPGRGDTSSQLINAIFGLTVMVMAAVALPMVIKFVAPVAAMGSSSAFSGGAAMGVVAAGASIVALAGTGGGAGAAAGAGRSTGASTATTSAASSGGGKPGPEGPAGPQGAKDSGGTPPAGSNGTSGSNGANTRNSTGEPARMDPAKPAPSGSAPSSPSHGGTSPAPSQSGASPAPSSRPSSSGGAQAAIPPTQNISHLINQAGDEASREE